MVYIHNKLHFHISSFTLGLITGDTVQLLKSFAGLVALAAIILCYAIKTMPSDVKSHEEQDDSKQNFV